MDKIALGLLAGAGIAYFTEQLPSILLVFGCLFLSLIAALTNRLPFIIGLAFGLGWVWLSAWQLQSWPSDALTRQPYSIQVQVDELVDNNKNKDMLTVRASLLSFDESQLPWWQQPKVRLFWYKPTHKLKRGEIYTLRARLKPAHGTANQYSWHYQTWLLRHQIRATGSIKQFISVDSISHDQRQHWFDTLTEEIAPSFARHVFLALTLAERKGFDSQQWYTLKATGTGHLVAISGLHIGMSAWCFATLLMLANKLFGLRYELYVPLRVIAIVSGAGFYCWLAGLGVTSLRAIVMLSLVLVAWCSQKRWPKSRIVLFAAAILVLVDPFVLLDIGFWLSLYAVVSIMFLYHVFHLSRRSWWQQLLMLQCGIAVLMVPMTAYMFAGISLHALWINLIAVPLVSFIFVPLALLCMILFAVGADASALVIAHLSVAMLQPLLDYLTHFSEYEHAWISLADLALWRVVALIIVIAILCLSSRIQTKIILSLLLAVISLIDLDRRHLLQLDVLDVGQGLAIVVSEGEQRLLYDTGEKYWSGSSAAERILLPFLLKHGENIKLAIVSHSDNDHAGGVPTLQASRLKMEHWVTNLSLPSVKRHPCLAGLDLILDKRVQVEVLWPLVEKGDDNDDSCVVKVSAGTQSILITGDISSKVEQQLIHLYSNRLDSSVLIVPHHGSLTSSSLAFIQAVSPTVALVSSGFQNRFNHPDPKVLERYEKLQIPVFNTAEVGQISIVFSENAFRLSTFRQDIQPYWFRNL